MASIEVNGIKKVYNLGEYNSKTLSEAVTQFSKNIFSNNKVISNKKEFLALDDISFKANEGEVIGIIGRNGAGKSTLLKILSRITAPSSGNFRAKGRISSLLEVGTGFHPELTGRENVYLNGALLGMSKKEVSLKFDEIAAFSGIENYIDTPVKRYSSGMLVRLGFAVAAHLESEILILDEVLAVGDSEFQAKCFDKMYDIGKKGRIVFFVSHNMGAIQHLCNRGIVLDSGRMKFDGDIPSSISYYNSILNKTIENDLGTRTDFKGNGKIKFTKAHISIPNSNIRGVLKSGEDASFVFSFKVFDQSILNKNIIARFSIIDQIGNAVCYSSNQITNDQITVHKNEFEIECSIKKISLTPGVYYISAYIGEENLPFQYFEKLEKFEIFPGNFYFTGRLPEFGHSTTLLDYRWKEL